MPEASDGAEVAGTCELLIVGPGIELGSSARPVYALKH